MLSNKLVCLFLVVFSVVQFQAVQTLSLKQSSHRGGNLLFCGLAAKSGGHTYRLMGETMMGMMQVVSTKRLNPENNCQKMKFLAYVGAYKPFRLSTLNEKGCKFNNSKISTLNILQVYKHGNNVELVFKEKRKERKENHYHSLFLIPVEKSSKQKFNFSCIKTQTCEFYLATEIRGVTYFLTINKNGAFKVLRGGLIDVGSKYVKSAFMHTKKLHYVREMLDELTYSDVTDMPVKFHLEFF